MWTVEPAVTGGAKRALIVGGIAVAVAVLLVGGVWWWSQASSTGGRGELILHSGGYGSQDGMDVEVTRCDGDADGVFRLEASGEDVLSVVVTREPGEPPLDRIEVVLVDATGRTDTWVASGPGLFVIDENGVSPANPDAFAGEPLDFHQQAGGTGGSGTFEASCPQI
jgi:hypothetical protein